jgi:putative aldouronate transport system permease protein
MRNQDNVELIRRKGIGVALRRFWPLYLMMVPAALYFIIFQYGPMAGIVIAFKNYIPKKGMLKSDWAEPWYKWFQYFFKSPSSRQVVINTLVLSLLKLLFCMIPPLIFALAVSECRLKGLCRVVQTVSYLPHFLSWVIIYGICIAMLSESTGIINQFMKNMGLAPIPFLTSNQYFRGVLVGTELWKTLGWSSIIYLAAIMGIDTEIYDAATIDGCGRFRRIWHVTLPCLRKIFVVLLILRVGKILDAGFNQVFVFINDRVRPSSEIIDTWVYSEGLGQGRYSLSTAVGLLKSVLSCFLVFGTNSLAKKWDSALW